MRMCCLLFFYMFLDRSLDLPRFANVYNVYCVVILIDLVCIWDSLYTKAALVYGQMNEPPGARARVALTGLTVAEYFRDEEGQECGKLEIRNSENLLSMDGGQVFSISDARMILQDQESQEPIKNLE